VRCHSLEQGVQIINRESRPEDYFGPGNLTPYRTSTRADSPTLSCADFMLTVHHFQRLQQHRAQIIQSAPILAPKVPSFQQAERDMTRETFS
jgi:hypothetical protein